MFPSYLNNHLISIEVVKLRNVDKGRKILIKLIGPGFIYYFTLNVNSYPDRTHTQFSIKKKSTPIRFESYIITRHIAQQFIYVRPNSPHSWVSFLFF